jgi:predicted DNA-binding transcriptional regulator AlpA
MEAVSASIVRQLTSPRAVLLNAKDAARYLSISWAHFYALHSAGRIGPLPIHLGRRALWRRAEIEAWVEAGCPSRERWQVINHGQ